MSSYLPSPLSSPPGEARLIIYRRGMSSPIELSAPYHLVMSILGELCVSGAVERVLVEWGDENARNWDTGGYITHVYIPEWSSN